MASMNDPPPIPVMPPKPSTKQKVIRRSTEVGISLLLVVAAVVTLYWWGGSFSVWPKLRAEFPRYSAPAGFDVLGKIETGSVACFISCDSPRIWLVLETSMDGKAACVELRKSLDALVLHVEAVSPVEETSRLCLFGADLPRAGERAGVVGRIQPTADVAADPHEEEGVVRLAVRATESLLAIIAFDSGID